MNIEHKYNSLKSILNSLGRVVVAYSGGVDSTFLLKAAVDALGPANVLACIGISASLARSQYQQAIDNARLIGADVREVQVDEMSDPAYAANKADRCFHCKSHLYQLLLNVAKETGLQNVVCGANLDDQDDFRPGNRAAAVFGIRAPLMEAGLTKLEIRELSRMFQLPTADIPASPCLASRISYGEFITADKLAQVEAAEELLRSLGFIEFRVRHHGDIARIEVPVGEIAKLASDPMRTEVAAGLRQLGFKFVALDLGGFASGSLNRSLSDDEKRSALK